MERTNSAPVVESRQTPGVEVRNSSIGGKGCFATRPIYQGETIHVLTGELLNGQEVDKKRGDIIRLFNYCRSRKSPRLAYG